MADVKWLEEKLAEADKCKRLLAFHHHPLSPALPYKMNNGCRIFSSYDFFPSGFSFSLCPQGWRKSIGLIDAFVIVSILIGKCGNRWKKSCYNFWKIYFPWNSVIYVMPKKRSVALYFVLIFYLLKRGN